MEQGTKRLHSVLKFQPYFKWAKMKDLAKSYEYEEPVAIVPDEEQQVCKTKENIENLKRCTMCGEWKNLDEFTAGYGECKPCYAKYRSGQRVKKNEAGESVRYCSFCNEWKPLTEFNKGRTRCKSCFSDYQKEYRAKNKVKDGFKVCKTCGQEKPISEFWTHQNSCKVCTNAQTKHLAKLRDEKMHEAFLNQDLEREKASSDIGLKYCPSCMKVKPLAEFPVNLLSSDGFHDECEACTLTESAQNHKFIESEKERRERLKREKELQA